MRDFKGNNYGTIVDKSITIKYGGKYYQDTKITKEETTIGNIIKEKVIEAIVGFILTGMSALINSFQLTERGDSLEWNKELSVSAIKWVLLIIGIVLVISCLLDVINVILLSRRGAFVEFNSKFSWISIIGEILFDTENGTQKNDRSTGKCYINIDGKIHIIKGKKCPICETEPIGNMYLRYFMKKRMYYWECSQNQMHKIAFDYKKKI